MEAPDALAADAASGPLVADLPILFVDDEPDVLKALRRTVERSGWPACFETDPQQALGRIAEQEFSVVVSDFRMPGVDGVELLRQVRDRWPGTERVLLTAHADADALERGINDAGVGRFLRKPWKRDVLMRVLDQARSENRLRREHQVLQERLRNRNDELSYLNRLLQLSVEDRERSLVRYRRRWDAALQAISDPLIIVNENLRIEVANDAAARLAGVALEDLEGVPCHRALFARSAPCSGCPIGAGTGEVTTTTRSGARVFDARAYVIPGASPTHLCIYRDVTRERDFAAHAAHVEKMAAIGRLAGGVAHEINNPLHGILSFVQLAQKADGDGEKLARYHEVIRECAVRCRDIVSSLRNFSRRATVGERRRADLNDICQRAMVLFERAQDVEVRFAPHAEPAWCRANANQVTQVVVNLVQNAVDASPSAGVVEVRVAPADDGWVVTVDDAGPGVDPAQRDQIFEPFFTTKPEGVGTGLGLAISHTIMQEHGGVIRVSDGPLGGARFEIRLPTGLAADAVEESAEAPAARPGEEVAAPVAEEVDGDG